MFRPTQAIINLNALKANYRRLQNLIPDGFLCPMVKANAYGHGAIPVARALEEEGCKQVGVVLVEEALELREHGAQFDILVFTRLTKESARACCERGLIPVVSHAMDLEYLRETDRPVRVHLKFDTGMHRMGFDLGEAKRLRDFFRESHRVRLEGICTHLSHGFDAAESDGISARQMARFEEVYAQFGDSKIQRHVLNSDALLARAKAKKSIEQWGARPGLALYGLYQNEIVEPVLSLSTRLDLVRKIGRGESVSYGARWTASKESWVGVIPYGYADGYHRVLTNKSQVLFRGKRVPVVGTICMDYCLVDLTENLKEGLPQVGEEVVIWGNQQNSSISAVELADWAQTIAYEITTGVSSRVPRIYK